VAKLVPKTLDQQLSALEDHLYLLCRTLRELASGDSAHLRQLAGQLRGLVCTSSGMPGLLWRLRDAVGVDDGVSIRYPGRVDTSNPITKGLVFVGAPVRADGTGPDAIPQETWSLHQHIHEHEALFVDGLSITHEHLISRLANETGVAHEAHGVSKEIAKLNSILLGDVQPYFQVLDENARLTLLVGDRILCAAEARGYARRRPASLADDLPRVDSTRFASTLDVPAINLSSNEGTILMVLKLPKLNADKSSTGLPIRFPPLSQGAVTVQAEMSHRGRIRISTQGLPLPYFGFDFYPPEADADSVAIAITWKGFNATGYVAGHQVAGSRDDEA
jgi:hypothetical protein